MHLAVDTLGHLLALYATPQAVQAVTREPASAALADQDYTGQQPADDALAHVTHLQVVKPPEVKHGSLLLSRRWIVQRSFAWNMCFRRLVCEHERHVNLLARDSWMLSICPPDPAATKKACCSPAATAPRATDAARSPPR
jgi:transposase